LILTNQLVNAKYVLPFQDGIVMIAAEISARTILTATNKIVIVEKLENVKVSAEFIKDENWWFLVPASISPLLVLMPVIPRNSLLHSYIRYSMLMLNLSGLDDGFARLLLYFPVLCQLDPP
jgi:hypothetical protein